MHVSLQRFEYPLMFSCINISDIKKKKTYFSSVKKKYHFVLQKKAFIEHLCIKN